MPPSPSRRTILYFPPTVCPTSGCASASLCVPCVMTCKPRTKGGIFASGLGGDGFGNPMTYVLVRAGPAFDLPSARVPELPAASIEVEVILVDRIEIRADGVGEVGFVPQPSEHL